MGRPRSLDDAKRKTIINAIRMGLGRATAAAIAETTVFTIRRECERNENFRNQMKRAEADCESVAVQRIRNARQWQASAWFLERKFPKQWGRHKVTQAYMQDHEEKQLPGDKPPDEIKGDLAV